MRNVTKVFLTSLTLLALASTTASADVAKGQKLFTKKLKKACGISGAAMAGKHTQTEWNEINTAGNMAGEIKNICPNITDGALKEKYLPHYFDFFHEYGSDSGNVPSC